MTGNRRYAPNRGIARAFLFGIALASIIGAPAWVPSSAKLHRTLLSSLNGRRVGWYAPHSPAPVLTSGVKTVPAGVLLRLPGTAEVVWTSPLPGTPRLFLAPRYKNWMWPKRLHTGVDLITWQRTLDPTGRVMLLGQSRGRLSASTRRREPVGRAMTLELKADARVETSGKMNQILKGPEQPEVAANCSTSTATPASDFKVQRTKLVHSGGTALSLSANVGRACYFARFSGAGTYLIQMKARSLAGSQPSLCVWSAPFGPCLWSWYGQASHSWQRVRKLVMVPRDSYLYLYAPAWSGHLTSVQFTAVHVWHVELPPRAAYIEAPDASNKS